LRRIAFIVPVAVLAVVAAVFYAGLEKPPPAERPSPLVGKPAPTFVLAALDARTAGFARADLAGRPAVVNFWASWCAPCRLEHPLLRALKGMGGVRLYGVVYKDQAAKARAFLDELGNPFDRIGVDPAGRAAIDWGITGVPETFVVDANGIVRAHVAGPLTPEVVEQVVLPALRRGNAG
jgi:cytochrome c biogenesis protein CcmG/thiol:disulfide interchange protein DsbE